METILLTRKNLILAWISNYKPSKVCDDITYPSPNFHTVEGWEWIIILTFYKGSNNVSMLKIELIHISKRGPLSIINESLTISFKTELYEKAIDIFITRHIILH